MSTSATNVPMPHGAESGPASRLPRPGMRNRHRTPALHRAVGWAAAAGTLPYLTLKALWLGGSDAGMNHSSTITDTTMLVGNGMTAAADVLLVALAFALTHRWGYRLPAWLLLLPVWIGTGFLVPIVVAILPGAVTSLGLTGAVGDGSLAPWVGPLVYGGFAWQGIFLIAAFLLHAHTRWSAAVTALPDTTADPLLRVVAGGGATMAVLSAGLHLTTAGGTSSLLPLTNAAFALLGAAGVLALARGATTHRWVAVAATWTGGGAAFSWGLYHTVLAVGVDGFSATPGVAGLAFLTGLLGGFGLAVAGLLALPIRPQGTGSQGPDPRGPCYLDKENR